jgi:hypothetical protein
MFEGSPGADRGREVTFNQIESNQLLTNARFASQHRMVSTITFTILSFKKNVARTMDQPKAGIVNCAILEGTAKTSLRDWRGHETELANKQSLGGAFEKILRQRLDIKCPYCWLTNLSSKV